VETLRAGLAAIEWPDDELSVFATLKGSLFAIRDEYCCDTGMSGAVCIPSTRAPPRPMHPFTRIRNGGECPHAAGRIASRAESQVVCGHGKCVARSDAGPHAGFVLRPGGNQILANVARVADLGRTYEISGGLSFRGFVEELAAQAEKEDAAEAPVLEEDSDGVRLMTVHGAKGLEFPVVILADLTANIAGARTRSICRRRTASVRPRACCVARRASWSITRRGRVRGNRRKAFGLPMSRRRELGICW